MQLKKLTFLLFITFVHCVYTDCNAAQYVNKIDPQIMLQNINNAGKIPPQYKNSCDGQPGTCVTLYDDINVQMMQAVQIAIEHVKQTKGWDLTCSATYRTDWNDDYIKCGDTNPNHAFEFQFDDVTESIDSTIQENIARAICKIYTGKRNVSGTKCNLETDMVAPFSESIRKFGYSVLCTPEKNTSNQSVCQVVFNYLPSGYELKTAFGINNRKFHNLQLQSASDLHFLLERYTKSMIEQDGQTLESFECNHSFNTYETDELLNPKDDILTCTANGKQIDFLFDDLNEAFDYQAQSGTAGLKCIADAGGTFDGQNCHGLTIEQCTELNTYLPGGTKWDTTLDTCILNDAKTASKINQYTDSAKTVLIATSFATITVLSGGTATVVIVGITAGMAGSAINITAQNKKESEIRKFIANSSKCTEKICAQEHLKTFIEQISQYHNDIDGQLLDAIDDEIVRLLELNPDITIQAIENAMENSDGFRNISNWTATEWLGFSGNVLSAMGAVVSIGSGVKTGWGAIIKMIRNKQPTTKVMKLIADTASAINDSSSPVVQIQQFLDS